MNHSDNPLHSPNGRISENNQYIINGTMLGVLCLMAICVIVLFCYYIAWVLQNGREAERRARSENLGISNSSPTELVHVPVFVPHTFPVSMSYPRRGSQGPSIRKAEVEREATPPPPSYESIFPSAGTVVVNNPLALQ